MRYLDGGFYTLHDEWFWFRLMNGQRVSGADVEPHPGRFATVQEIVAWALEQDELELVVQVNGVKRGTVRVPQSADQRALEGVVKSLDFVQRQVGAKTVKRVVVVPGRLVNVVV